MKAQVREFATPRSSAQAPVRFADVVEEVSKLTPDPIEAALVIDRMFRGRKIRFVEHPDCAVLTLTR